VTGDRPIEIVQVDLPEDSDQPICAIYDDGEGAIVASINVRYPKAEAHVRAHVARGFGAVLLCRADCDGTQR